MQQAPARPASANPLAALAGALPRSILVVVDPAARIAGALLMLLFAWDQYDTFDQYFANTWVYAILVSVVAVVTSAQFPGIRGAWIASIGAAFVFTGGVMFASEWYGVGTMIGGAIAWLATAALIHQRGRGPLPIVGGLVIGTGAAFAAVVLTVLLFE